MTRLTEYHGNVAVIKGKQYEKAAEKLAYYETLEELGKLAEVTRCKGCKLLQECKIGQYLGLEGYCSHAEPVDLAVVE
jgi:hypothetical protein